MRVFIYIFQLVSVKSGPHGRGTQAAWMPCRVKAEYYLQSAWVNVLRGSKEITFFKVMTDACC
jgi:hypothetical protein